MKVPLSNVNLSDLEREYAHNALASGWISGSGSYLMRFEDALAVRLSRKHAIAVTNGTAALELALRVLGISSGDEVIVPALTFVSPAATVLAVGATPVLADITEESWTIDPAEVARLRTSRTKAIIAVDLLGHPCDYEQLLGLGLPVVEDAAEAHGSLYRGKPSGGLGVISTLSFHANKTITTGEGGSVATDADELAADMRLIANHGMSPARPYWHDVVGRNFRMTNVTAAIGLAQVERWDDLVSARNEVASRYDAELAGSSCRRRPVASWAMEACWLYTVTIPQRAPAIEFVRSRGIDARAIWPALSSLPLFRNGARGTYPVATRIASTAAWLPTWAGMPIETISYVTDALRRALPTREG